LSDTTTGSAEPVKVGANEYKIGRLAIFDQMVVARRLMPALKGIVTPELLGAVMAARMAVQGDDKAPKGPLGGIDMTKLDVISLIRQIADSVYNLTDEDAERIVRTSLKAVTRKNPGGVFTPLLSPQGHFMFDDLKLGDTMQLAWKVIESHLGDFFSIAP
jgi:tail assembly chaperone